MSLLRKKFKMVYVCVICMTKELPLLSLWGETRTLLEAVVSPAVDLRPLSHRVLLACKDCMKLMETVLSFQKTAVIGVKHLLSLPTSQRLTLTGRHLVNIAPAGTRLPMRQVPAPTVIGSTGNAPRPLLFKIVGSPGGTPVTITPAGNCTPIQNLSAPKDIGASRKLPQPLVFKDTGDPLFVPVKTEPGVPLVDVKVECESETVKQQLTHEVDIKFEHDAASGSTSATDSAESDIEDSIPLSTVSTKNALGNCQNQLTHGLPTPEDTPQIATFTHNQKTTLGYDGYPVYATRPHVEDEPVTPGTLPKLPKLLPRPARAGGVARGAGAPHVVSKLTSKPAAMQLASSAKAVKGQTASFPRDVTDVAGRAASSALPVAQPAVKQSWYIRVLPDEEVAAAREAARAAPEFVEAQYKCHYCLIAFKCEKGKALHDKTQHPSLDGSYRCQVCGHRASEVSAWREHVRAHATRYCCCYCPFSAGDVPAIRQHYCEPKLQQWEKTNFVKSLFKEKVKKPPPPVKCAECYARFADQAKLEKHQERVHKKHQGLQVCKVCNKQFSNRTRLYHHLYVHKRQEERSVRPGPRPELFCAVCRREFNSPSAFRAHQLTRKHGGTTDHWRHECDECGRVFASKTRVRQHIEVVHLKQKNYRCGVCAARCSTAARRRAHERSHAPRARPHVCHLCGKTYTIVKSLREHLLAHAGLRPLACALCPATFTYAAARYTHHRLKHLRLGAWRPRARTGTGALRNISATENMPKFS